MRNFGIAAVVLAVVAACAEQSNPPPESEPDDTADSGSGGSSATGGKGSTTNGGSLSNAGTSSGGKPSGGSNTGGTSEENLGGEANDIGGKANGGTGGKANGGTAGKASGGNGGAGGKASGGSGGKAGGGAGGTNGSAGTGGSGGSCTSSPNGPIQGLSARYEAEIKGATGSGIGSKLIIANAGPSTLNLTDLKLRYYLTNEVSATIGKTINWAWYRPNAGGAQVDKKSKVSFNVVPMPCAGNNANTYFEFTFTADAGLLEPGYQIYFSWTANNGASQNFTQSNDYSFDSNAVEGSDDTKIVVLQNSGTRVWGTEP